LAFAASNEHLFLNVAMAACKAALDPAHGVVGSTLVTTMARNGTDFGIRVSGLGDRWFTAPAETPRGLYFPGFAAGDANPDIGDSAITETGGLGGFAMGGAPAIVQFVGGTPAEALEYTRRMYEITAGESAAYRLPTLDFRGTPTGIDVRLVVQTGILPQITTGMAHREAGVRLVLTAADLGERNQPSPLLIPHPTLTHARTQRPLATDEVRYVGELVAFVVATDRYLAEDAAALIEVEYEPLPVVTDLATALASGAARVHADVPENRAARFRQAVGDAAGALRRAPRGRREGLAIERSCGSPIETRGVVAEWDARRRVLRVWDSTQA